MLIPVHDLGIVRLTKKSRHHDPHKQRETDKYTNPVASREYILEYLNEKGRPVTFENLATVFSIESPEEKEGLRRRLNAMRRDGQIISNRRGSYGLVKDMALVAGRVSGHKDGFGFLIPDEGGSDIFLPAREMRQVFSDDRVLVRVANEHKRRREGCIVEVLERNTQTIVGKYYQDAGISFVDPDNKSVVQDILIPAGNEGGAEHGQFVVAKIITQPTPRRQPQGKVIEVLGDQLTPGMEVELALRAHDLPFRWSDAVLAEADKFATEVTEAEVGDRVDLRDKAFVTIDGRDARDFDDAIYCEEAAGGGWKLWVAIADVSHYVRRDTALEAEAELRGNSVYFPSRVIPMLPVNLSNELCSLKPDVDRLVMVCEMHVNAQGSVKKYKFHNAVIHSHARLIYDDVALMLDGKSAIPEDISPSLKAVYHLYKCLVSQRKLRGAIEFETTETRIEFDDDGKIAQIVPVERNDAHKVIEEAMLLANVCTSSFLQHAGIPTLYRIHEGPDEQKLLALRDFLKAFGLRLTGGASPTAMDYAKLLERTKKRDDAHLLQTVMLRSLRQAIYSPENKGHFGLSYDAYCHFTSPIRRYPDLLVHRAIKHMLKKNRAEGFRYTEENMFEFGGHCSTTERRADLATRDATDWLKCEYMLDKVGQEFDGVIVDVTGFGVFVELKNIYVQGLLHITALKNDYYHFDPIHHALRGKHSGKDYRLGDSIRVLVARVDLDKREIDFELADEI